MNNAFKLLIIVACLSVLKTKAQEMVLTLNSGHTKNISSIRFSPDGNLVVSGSADYSIKLWDTHTDKEIRSLTGHGEVAKVVMFSPDGKKVISVGGKEIRVWDVLTGKDLQTIPIACKYISAADISPDGKTVVIGINETKSKTVKIIDIETGKEVQSLKGHKREVRNLHFSHDGKKIVACDYGGVTLIWDVETATILHTFDLWSGSASFSPDGKHVALATDGKLMVMSIETGQIIKSRYSKFDGALFHPDNKTILFLNEDKTIAFWNFETDKIVKTVKGNKSLGSAICLSPDSKKLISAGTDNSLKLLDIETDREIFSFGGQRSSAVESIVFSPDGGRIAHCGDSTIKVWNTKTGQFAKVIRLKKDWLRTLAFSPDSKVIASGGNGKILKLWDVETGLELKSFTSKGEIWAASFSPDGKKLAFGGSDNKITLLDAAGFEELKTFEGHSDYVVSIKFSPDGKKLISGSFDNTIKKWDVETGVAEKSISASKETSMSMTLSQDGKKLASWGNSNYFITYDLESGKELNKFKGHDWGVWDVAFSPDGKKMVSGCRDNKIKLWDAETGEDLKTLDGHLSLVYSVLFSPNGKWVISGSEDHTLKIWDAQSGQIMLTLVSFNDGNWVAVGADGRFDGSQDGIKFLHFTKGMEIIPLESFYEQYYTPGLMAMILFGEKMLPVEVNISDLKPKPKIEIVSPEKNTTMQNSQIEVNVKVTDMGGGIDEILLYHNGKLLETTSRGFKAAIQNNDTKTKTFTVNLVSGVNTLKATAFNNQRTEGIPDEISVTYKSVETSKPNLYLFVIGINEYKNPKYNLNYAIADASAFRDEIQKGSSPIFGNINTTFIKDSEATKTRIVADLTKITALAKQEDMFVFYYAGHGAMSEEEKSLFYLIPTDVTQMFQATALEQKAISATELKQFSTQIKAQKQLFILDACQSGGMENVLAARGAAEEKAIAQLARSTGTYWLAASNSDQVAGEFAKLGHGLFTYCILQAFSGKADGQNDKKITVQELSSFLNDQVPIISKQHKGSEQYPVTYGFGMDFPVIIVK